MVRRVFLPAGLLGIVAGLVLAVPVTIPAVAAAPDIAISRFSTPQVAAQAFYKVYGASPRTGALPDATVRTHYAPVLSARLNTLLAQAEAAQTRFAARARKGIAPPMIGGDLFTSNIDGATGWVVGKCTQAGVQARCGVALTYQRPGARLVQWHDTLVLVHAAGGWRVDDVLYDPAFAAGNTGSLTQMLKMMVAQAPP